MYGGPQSNNESDIQPSCRSSLQNISSIPFLDMSSFQPTVTNRQSGFESMESMDSDLNSGKTTPMNYMRGAPSGMQQISHPIRNKSLTSDSEDGGNVLGNFLRSQPPAAYDALDIETFGEVGAYRVESGGDLTPEPWIESSPLTARDSLRQLAIPQAPLTNQFGMEHLTLAPNNMHNTYHEGEEPYYPHDTRQYGLEESYYQNQRAQGQTQGLAQGQGGYSQHQYQQQGQYAPQTHHYTQQGVQQGVQGQGQGQSYGNTTPRIGAVGSSVNTRTTTNTNHRANPQYYQTQQSQGQVQGQGQYTQYAPQGHQQHQYNHGSYASAPQTPLSAYRAVQSQQGLGQMHTQAPPQMQGQGQYAQYHPHTTHGHAHTHAQSLRSHSHSSEEDNTTSAVNTNNGIQAFGRTSRDYNDTSASNARALYPTTAPAVRTPKMAYHPTHNNYTTTATSTGMLDMQQELVYQVQFKRGCRAFTLSARAGVVVNERDFVVVEADRGEDVGIVVEIMSMHAFLERRMNAIRPTPQQGESEDQNVGCILRLATLHERQQLPEKFHAEKEIVQSCNDLAQHGFGLPITVFEAEFQFDRRKLTVYYDCTVRIDFRDFVRQLYSTYKARIWMKKMSPAVLPEVQPFAAMALATGVQFGGV